MNDINPEKEIFRLNDLGIKFSNEGKYNQAIKYLLSSSAIAEKINHEIGL